MPYLYQQRLAKALTKRAVVDGEVCVLEIPTGTGKSVVINLAAHALLELADVKKVFIVSATPFLSQYGFQNYSLKATGTDGFYPGFAGFRIGHFPVQMFPSVPDHGLPHCAFLIDELDACIAAARCGVDEESVPGSFVFAYTARKLAKAKVIAGISGTFADDAQSQFRAMIGTRRLFTSKVRPFDTDGRYRLEEIVKIADDAEYEEACRRWILDRIDAVHDKEHVIVIDAALKTNGDSWLAETDHLWGNRVRVFNDWSSSNYQANCTEIGRLRGEVSTNFVLHIDLDGVRGVDYAMDSPARVIVKWNVSTLSDFRQAAGRGARKFTDTCPVDLIVTKGSLLANLRKDEIEQALADSVPFSAQQDACKNQICEALHGRTFVKGDDEALKEALGVLNDPKALILDDGATAQAADCKARYQTIRRAFPGVLPEKQADLMLKNMFE